MDPGVERLDGERRGRGFDAEDLAGFARPPLRAAGDVHVPDADGADGQRVLQVGPLVAARAVRCHGRVDGAGGGRQRGERVVLGRRRLIGFVHHRGRVMRAPSYSEHRRRRAQT
jgi:hypothetical protein